VTKTVFVIATLLMGSAAGADLSTTLRVVTPSRDGDSSCAPKSPSHEPSITWQRDGTAIVHAFVHFISEVSASEDAPKVRLDGSKLDLCYNITVDPSKGRGPHLTCAEDTYQPLEFKVSGLPRGDYSLSVKICGWEG